MTSFKVSVSPSFANRGIYSLDLTITCIKMGCFAAKIVKNNSVAHSDHPGRKSIATNTVTFRSPDHGEERRSLSPTNEDTGRASDGIGIVRTTYSRVVSTGRGVTSSGVTLSDTGKSNFERNLEYLETKTLPKNGNNFSNITSSVVLPDNSIVLCDSSNNMLYLLDSDLVFKYYVTVDNEPRTMCIVENRETCYVIAVTFPKRRLIQLFKISSDTMSKVKDIRTDSECWGICCFNKSLIFSTDSGLVFRDVGKNKSRWKRYGHVFQSKVSLTLAANVVYICNRGSDGQVSSIKGMRVDDMDEDDGEIIFKKYFPIKIVSCAVDNEHNIYICDNEKKDILQLESSNEQARKLQLYDKKDILQLNSVNRRDRKLKARAGRDKGWQHINFLPDSNKIILIEARSNYMFIFKLI